MKTQEKIVKTIEHLFLNPRIYSSVKMFNVTKIAEKAPELAPG